MNTHYDLIIIGGGFGGLHCALKLEQFEGRILLVDRNNYHLFQPLLYQVASAALSSVKIATPLREILRAQENVTVLMGEVSAIDRFDRSLLIGEQKYFFSRLVVAIGDRQNYFGHEEWKEHAFGLKGLGDAFRARNRILMSYEAAELEEDEEEVRRLLTFVVIGGGPTGVELAGALAEIAHKTLVSEFRRINPAHAKVYLVEAAPKILGMYSDKTCARATKQLHSLGVEVKTDTKVMDIQAGRVVLEDEVIETQNIFWAAGNMGLPLLKTLETELSRRGQVVVREDLSIKEDPNIFVIGDAACFMQEGKQLPGLAPVAIQQGKFLAERILNPKSEGNKFRYFDKGSLATIGKSRAVGEVGPLKLSGLIAWLTWCVVHLYFLILVRNRFSLFATWVYTYFTSDRGARVISERNP